MSGKDGKVTYAAMKLGDDLIIMGYPGSRYKNPKKVGKATQIVYVKVKDADKSLRLLLNFLADLVTTAARLRLAGARGPNPPRPLDHGSLGKAASLTSTQG